jgi:hypothetical protein
MDFSLRLLELSSSIAGRRIKTANHLTGPTRNWGLSAVALRAPCDVRHWCSRHS